MNQILKIISIISLILIVVPPSLFYFDRVSLETNKTLLLIGTVAWFAASICMAKGKSNT